MCRVWKLGLAHFLIAFALGSACGSAAPRGSGIVDRSVLPNDIEALIAFADEIYGRTRQLKPSAEAAAALEAALHEQPESYAALWRAARAFVAIAERLRTPEMRIRFAREARTHASRAVEVDPNSPEGHYYLAAASGLLASAQVAPSRAVQAALETPLLWLVDNCPHYDDGGPLRILGALYVKAPSWPAGVGDLDEGLELLERAVEEHPDHPLNHLFLAEAFAKLGRNTDAARELKIVLQAPREGEWALIGGRFRSDARQLLRDLDEHP